MDEAAAWQFVQTWPRYDLQLKLRNVRAQHSERALKLERDLSVGRYDLARLPANKRWLAAKRYIAAHETLRKLEWDGKNLELAAELSKTWAYNITLLLIRSRATPACRRAPVRGI